MSFLLRKKNFKFDVKLEAEELTSVPLVSGVLFAKIRLLDGGQKAVWITPREEVFNHEVRWRTALQFPVKLSASILGGVLEKCICRISIRKELKGGKSYQKLGFVDINLSEFAGAGFATQRYLLEGYDSKRRLDNSLLKINVCMKLLSGDPCFKVPRSSCSNRSFTDRSFEDVELHSGNKGAVCEEYNSDSLNSRSSGFGSLPNGEPLDACLTLSKAEGDAVTVVSKTFHDDIISLPSQKSQSSIDFSASVASQRSFSVSYKVSVDNYYPQRFSSTYGPRQCQIETNSTEFRDIEQFVEELLQETNFCQEEKSVTPEDVRLQLYMTNDGRALIGSVSPVHMTSSMTSSTADCQIPSSS